MVYNILLFMLLGIYSYAAFSSLPVIPLLNITGPQHRKPRTNIIGNGAGNAAASDGVFTRVWNLS